MGVILLNFTSHILWITFIYATCHCSYIAVALAKYDHYVFMILKNMDNNRTGNIGLVKSTLNCWCPLRNYCWTAWHPQHNKIFHLLFWLTWPKMFLYPNHWYLQKLFPPHNDGLVQDCSISIANAMETLQSCNKPLILPWHQFLLLVSRWVYSYCLCVSHE